MTLRTLPNALWCSLLCPLLLAACATVDYTPREYPLRDGVISPFGVAGTARITNAQPSTTPVIVYDYGGVQWQSTLQAITAVMSAQANRELAKHGRPTHDAPPKTIALKVTALRSEYTGAFFWKSHIDFEALLGTVQTVHFSVAHSSGVLEQDLNGCIAEGVMTLLTDARVRAYLAR